MWDWLEVLKQRQAALEIVLERRIIERGGHASISLNQYLGIHLWLEVEGHSVTPDENLQNPVFRLETIVHIRALHSSQHIDWGHGNAHLLDKLDLGIKHTFIIII